MKAQLIRAADLKPGDLVDLEGDAYADTLGPGRVPPLPDDEAEIWETIRESYCLEYARVGEIEIETPECAAVYFEGFAVGFPVGHRLPVVAREGGDA